MREAMLPPKLRDWRAKLSAKAKQEKRYRFYSPAPAGSAIRRRCARPGIKSGPTQDRRESMA